MRVSFACLGLAWCALACAEAPRTESKSPEGASTESEASSTQASATAAPSPLSDQAPPAFRADFTTMDMDHLWNVFGAQSGNREVKARPDGLLVRIADAERPWDAVGLRSAKLKVDGDFDLRGRFREFSAAGNGSAKLLVVDAASPRGEAAYVERIQIDGKNLFKFGGEVEKSLENWGFTEASGDAADLRLVRSGATLHAYARADEHSEWKEFAPPQPVPQSMPKVLKIGVKLSAEAHKSVQVMWTDLTLDGRLIRSD